MDKSRNQEGKGYKWLRCQKSSENLYVSVRSMIRRQQSSGITSLSIWLKSYWDDERLIMYSTIQSWAEFRLQWDSKLEPHDSKSGVLITVYPLYIGTRYNDKIHYNDNLTGTKPSLKRWQLFRNNARTLYFKILSEQMLWTFVRITSLRWF